MIGWFKRLLVAVIIFSSRVASHNQHLRSYNRMPRHYLNSGAFLLRDDPLDVANFIIFHFWV